MGNNNSYYLVPGRDLNAIGGIIRDKNGYLNSTATCLSQVYMIDITTINYTEDALFTVLWSAYLGNDIQIGDICEIGFSTQGQGDYENPLIARAEILDIVLSNWGEEGNYTSYQFKFVQPFKKFNNLFDPSQSDFQTLYIAIYRPLDYQKMNSKEMITTLSNLSSSSLIPTTTLYLTNATDISSQLIPYVKNGELKYVYGYEEMYSLADSSNHVSLEVPTGAVIMLHTSNHLMFEHGQYEIVGANMNMDWLSDNTYWIKITDPDRVDILVY